MWIFRISCTDWMESSVWICVEQGTVWRTKSEILLACCGQLHVWCDPDFTVWSEPALLTAFPPVVSGGTMQLKTPATFWILTWWQFGLNQCCHFERLFFQINNTSVYIPSEPLLKRLSQRTVCGLSVPVLACRGHAKTAIWGSSVGSPETYNICTEE